MMYRTIRLSLAGLGAGLLAANAAVAQVVETVPPADPPRTNVEDVRERYRALRAAEKPHAETPADTVEVGEGAGVRRIEPVDPTLDPSSDEFSRVGDPQDPTLIAGSLPVGFDRIEIAEPVRREMFVVVKDYDAKINDVLARHARAHARLVMLEAAALAEPKTSGVVVEARSGERTAGYRPDGRNVAEEPSVVVRDIPADSPYAEAAAAARNEVIALHRQAVDLESQKLVALQKNLTAEQIQLVREYRIAPAAPVARPVHPVAPAPRGAVIEREIDVDRREVEVEERRVEPDGSQIEVEIEGPRLDDRD